MYKRYNISKVKMAIGLSAGIIAYIIAFCYFLFFTRQASLTLVMLGFLAIGLMREIPKFREELYSSIILDESDLQIVYSKKYIDKSFKWDEISVLEYKGYKFMPFNERMVVYYSNGSKIMIFYNYKNYLELWYNIVAICKDKSPDVRVDKRLSERINYNRYEN